MTCTCPKTYTESGLQRFAADVACPVHGVQKRELPHCATCACPGVPIVQTVELAAQIARAAAEHEATDE